MALRFAARSVTRTGLSERPVRLMSRLSPNPPLEIDPSLANLLNDVDVTLQKRKGHPSRKTLEYVSAAHEDDIPKILDEGAPNSSENLDRKSPAAIFGMQRPSQVVLPPELVSSIERIIAESDKPSISSDAKRLFRGSSVEDPSRDGHWTSEFTGTYRSRNQATRQEWRESVAFAAAALPAHYAAIYSVLLQVKQRLGDAWRVEHVLEWGAGTGAGLWASCSAFSVPHLEDHLSDHPSRDVWRGLSSSTLNTYSGIDKREGLLDLAKHLARGVDFGNTQVTYQQTFDAIELRKPGFRPNTIAISAFNGFHPPAGKQKLIERMWGSGSELMVIIDHATPEGFSFVAEAREALLQFGEDGIVESSDLQNMCHVVAPCPHDGLCPLLYPTSSKPKSVICSFQQRLQRPAFLRLTKHSKVGQENVNYSYVVIRRGLRPLNDGVHGGSGRVGQVARPALSDSDSYVEDSRTMSQIPQQDLRSSFDEPSQISLDTQQDVLRLESFSWPRLVFPPLKRSGHVILDVCAPEGAIIRMTIPRSQGPQQYYDARKSSWGDSFPHQPKNRPVVRWKASTLKGISSSTSEGEMRRDRKAARLRARQATTQAKAETSLRRARKRRESRSEIDDEVVNADPPDESEAQIIR